MSIPLVRVRYLADHARAYADMGGDSNRVMHRIGVPPQLLESPLALLPLARLEELTRLVLHDVGLGLTRVSAPRSIHDLGPLGAFLATIPSLHGALETFATAIKSEGSGMVFFFESRPDALWIRWSHAQTHDGLLRTHIERYNVWGLLAIIRHWAGARWLPADLWLRTDPIPEDDAFRSIARLRYHAPVSALSISHESLALSVVDPPPSPVGPPATAVIDLDSIDLIEATSQVLRTYLPTGSSTIVTLAEALGLSTRSLQRRLAEHGTTHSRLLEDVRRRLAVAHVEQRDRSIADVARELGYSDPAHFTRAFRRWFGLSPREFRRARQRR